MSSGKVQYYDGLRVSCQILRCKNCGSWYGHARLDHDIPAIRAFDSLQGLPYPFRKRGLAEQEKGNVRPQRQAQCNQFRRRQTRLPQMIGRHQRGRCIGGAAAEASAERYFLVEAHGDWADFIGESLEEKSIGFDADIVVDGAVDGNALLSEGELRSGEDFQVVEEVEDREEDGLEVVVAVGATREDVETEVNLAVGMSYHCRRRELYVLQGDGG